MFFFYSLYFSDPGGRVHAGGCGQRVDAEVREAHPRRRQQGFQQEPQGVQGVQGALGRELLRGVPLPGRGRQQQLRPRLLGTQLPPLGDPNSFALYNQHVIYGLS